MNETVKEVLDQGIELIRKAGEDKFPNDLYDWTLWTAPIVQSPEYMNKVLQNLGFLGEKLKTIRVLSGYVAGGQCHTDEPVVFEFETGDRLELEFVAGGTVRVSRSRLPRTLKCACNFVPDARFRDCIGQTLTAAGVVETKAFPTNALYYEGTLQRGQSYIEKIVLRFGEHSITLSSGLDEAIIEND